MNLLPNEIRSQLPPIYATEGMEDPIVYVKFFDPILQWRFYATEFDKNEKVFFGYIVGYEKELGYFSLDELEKYKGPLGLGIERDHYFTPKPLSKVKRGEM